jgi:hypothetical protein
MGEEHLRTWMDAMLETTVFGLAEYPPEVPLYWSNRSEEGIPIHRIN